MGLRTFHCFAGAGGGILADLLLGHRPVGACEIEKYPREVLKARQRDGHLPFFPIWDDINTLDGNPWRGVVDVLCGGFPCQDISSAGGGAGAIDGERSVLWTQQLRVASEMGRPYLFMENSPMLINRGLEYILGALSEMGYDARWGVWSSADVGACHIRERCWLFAYTTKEGLQGQHPECLHQQSVIQSPGITAEILREIDRQCSITSSGRMDDGLANRVGRIGAIGNGQDPRVAATAFRILSEGVICVPA